MEFLVKYYSQVRTHLGGLSASQRIAIGLCVVLVFGGVWSLLQWAGKAERVPLLSQSLTAEEQGKIVAQLQASGADYTTQGDRIFVRESDRTRLLATLQQTRALPARTAVSFAALMDDNNPFMAREESRWRKERALEGELSSVLMHFDGLSDAKVFIQTPQRRVIGGEGGKATASVYVNSRPGTTLDKGVVASIAEFVSGAVEGLSPDAVKIVDAASGRSYRLPSPQDALPFDVLDLRRQREEHFAGKIREHLGFISGVLVGVNAELNLDRKQVSETKLGKPVVSEEESVTSNTTRGGGGTSPGVQPNIAKAVSGGGMSESTSKDESRTTFDGRRDETVTHTLTTPGDVRRLTASINVPRSYYAGIYKQQSGKDEPKDADLEPIIKSETAKIRLQVRPLIAATDDNQIQVDWFYDSVAAGMGGMGGAAGTAPANAAAASMDTVAMLRQYGPQAGLGLLALFCLFSVMRMAKRAQVAIAPPPPPVAEKASRARKGTSSEDVDLLPGGEALAGEAISTEAVLEGREVGEDEIRIRHIIGQLGQMVKEDSNTAVSLVEQWVGQK